MSITPFHTFLYYHHFVNMKAALFSLAALASSAFAAPFNMASAGLVQRAPAVEQPAARDVGKAFQAIDDIVTNELGLGEIANEVGKANPAKRDLTDTAGLVELLSTALESVTSQTDLLNGIGQQVKNGDITKEEGEKQAAEQIGNTQFTLTQVVTELTGTAGLTVLDGDVNKVLNLVVTLLTVVLKTVDSLVTILGLTPQLNSLLHSVFSLLAQILVLVIGLVAAIVPGLIAALSPLLAGLGNGLLAPLLTPIVALVAGLALPGSLPLGNLPVV
ncbi:hypothetical protein HJFPF1_04623 [Paramyrothecium foliicola]|nr:hypothetical protein HJFPF1_04623 [Paramyrothecium foliicola]